MSLPAASHTFIPVRDPGSECVEGGQAQMEDVAGDGLELARDHSF